MRTALPNLCVAKAAAAAAADGGAGAGTAENFLMERRNESKERVARINNAASYTPCLDRYLRGPRSSLANAEIKNLYKSVATASQSLGEDESWTVRMLDLGLQVVLKKVNEEAAEFVSAVCCGRDLSVCRGAADVIYHVLLLLRVLGLDLAVLLRMLKLRSG